MTDTPKEEFDVFEKATEIVASNLAFFRDEGRSSPTNNEKLTAGHLVGGLWANGLLAKDLIDYQKQFVAVQSTITEKT